MSVTTTVVNTLIAQYGLPGIVIVAMGWALWKVVRRVKELEDRQMKLEADRHKALVELVRDYGEQTKSNTEAMIKLTSCLAAIKKSLERIERSKELDELREQVGKIQDAVVDGP